MVDPFKLACARLETAKALALIAVATRSKVWAAAALRHANEADAAFSKMENP